MGPDSIVIKNKTSGTANVSWSTSGDESSNLFLQFQNAMPKTVASSESIEKKFSVNDDLNSTAEFEKENSDLFMHVDFKDGFCDFQLGNNQQGDTFTGHTNHFSKDTEIMIFTKNEQAPGHCKATMTDDNKAIFTIE